MNQQSASTPKGWCPGALQPMPSGDGLIVRVRPRTGAISLGAVIAIAEAARRCGNGHIDLTRRANLQIRGVSTTTLPALHDVLAPHGLLDRTPEAEAVRNVVLSPLSGVDPDEVCDMRPLARALEAALMTDTDLWRLPAKFGFVLDGGGSLSLDVLRADIRLKAVRNGRDVVIVLGLDRLDDARSFAQSCPGDAPAAAIAMAKSYLEQHRPLAPLQEPAPHPDPLPVRTGRGNAARPRSWLGVTRLPDGCEVIGIAAAFGRLEADQLGALADAAIDAGCDELRLSPWRTLFLIAPDTAAAVRLLQSAASRGLIVDAADPLIGIDACPGAPACASATLDTRSSARALARLRPALTGVRSIHVSGCAKGCARSAPADLVLSARGERFTVLRDARADAAGDLSIGPDEVAELPRLLREMQKEPCRG